MLWILGGKEWEDEGRDECERVPFITLIGTGVLCRMYFISLSRKAQEAFLFSQIKMAFYVGSWYFLMVDDFKRKNLHIRHKIHEHNNHDAPHHLPNRPPSRHHSRLYSLPPAFLPLCRARRLPHHHRLTTNGATLEMKKGKPNSNVPSNMRSQYARAQEMESYRQQMMEYNYMTSSILKDRKCHLLASLHFNKRGDFIFFVSAIITLVQAGLAILAQSDLKSVPEGELEVYQSNLTVSIAFLAAFSVFWQSLVKNWNYNGKASLHDSSATALGKLYKTAELKRRQEKALKIKGGATTDSSDEGKEFMDTTLFDQLVKQYEQALEGCTSFVPSRIVAAFELLDNQIGVCKRKVDTGLDTDHKVRVEWEKVYPTLYKELFATIITQWCWPYFVPNPKSVVEQTLHRYKDEVNTELLDILIKRNTIIEESYGVFKDKEGKPVPESSDTNTSTLLAENNMTMEEKVEEKYEVFKIDEDKSVSESSVNTNTPSESNIGDVVVKPPHKSTQ